METPLQKDCNFNSQKEIFKFVNLKKLKKYDWRSRFVFASELCVIMRKILFDFKPICLNKPSNHKDVVGGLFLVDDVLKVSATSM